MKNIKDIKTKSLVYLWLNKEFFETNYPRGRAIEVFRWFHFALKRSKTKILYLDSRPDSYRDRGNDNFNGNLDAERRGIL
ncbi:MAG: hypothetical protein L3J25_08465 [Flavobacteriaceae bacterium]|nr:hypothetical protein [Flavobacteriaceae bacterium]